jgi:uncharacterized protein (TIGR02001 family)
VIVAQRRVLAAFLAVVALGAPALAHTQLAATIAVESDYRVRGRSVSDERPVASARLGFDDSSGIYADGSASIVASGNDGVRYLGYQLDAGFATNLGPLWTIDVGIARDDFRAPYPEGAGYERNEAYVGATHGPISAYLFASPNYGRSKSASLYGQLEGTIVPARGWRLTAHAGALELLEAKAPYSSLYDWRLGASRQVGNFEIHTALSGYVPGSEAYRLGIRTHTAFTVGASCSF